MANGGFERSVFVNCPFDDDYAPLLEAALFCIVHFGFSPRLANERLEAGKNRLDKIVGMIRGRNIRSTISPVARRRRPERISE